MNAHPPIEAGGAPFVTVVLPVLNGAGRLEDALIALERQDYARERFEVIVADGRSRDATVEIAESFGCRVVDNPGVTVAAGRNVGIQHARGELIAFSEDDIRLPPHWISSAVRLLSDSGAVGVGGPTPIPAHSSRWSHAVNAVFRLASGRGASVQSDRVLAGSADDLPGGNSLYSAQALRAVGPIDERLTTAEDVAMHHEMRQRGWELRLCPELAAEHHKRDSVGGFFRQMQRFAIGRVQLSRRWSGALSPLHWLAASIGPLGILVAGGLCLNGLVEGLIMTALLAMAAALIGIFIGLRQGERLGVALLLPVALAVFCAGWSSGFWSELVIPSRDPKRTAWLEKVADGLEEPLLASSRALRWIAGTFIALQCTLLAIFSQRAPFIMDEFQQGGYARHIEAGYYSALVPFKTVLFTYLYYLPRLWLDKASEILLAQRAETVLLVLAAMCVFYAVSRELGRTRTESGIVVAIVLGFSTFFEHAGSLRAEPAALLMGALALYTRVLSVARKRAHWYVFAAGVALGAAFFCTQKAAWFCVSLGLAGVASSWLEARREAGVSWLGGAASALRQSVCLLAGFGAVAAAYCCAFPPAAPEQVFRGVFLRSSQFALGSSSAYGDMSALAVQVLKRSWWLFALCGAGHVFATTRALRDPKRMLPWLMALCMGLIVLSWKEPWPYTFTWWIPFIALFAPDALRVVSFSASVRSRGGFRMLPMLVLISILVSTLPRTLYALSWSNRVQLEMVDRVESLLAPGEFYQDGIGMISTRPLSGLVWWDAPAVSRILAEFRRGENTELTNAFLDPPKVLILNYRTQNLWPALRPFLDTSYVPVEGGLLVAGARMQPGGARVAVAWEGRYALVERDGRRSIRRWSVDGQAAPGAIHVAAGLHQIEGGDCDACFMLPDDVVGKVVPTLEAKPVLLYDRPYVR